MSTSGSSCNEQTLRGTVTVQPLAQLSLLPSSGALDQVLCEEEAIVPILIELEGGDVITSITGLPDGITSSFDNVTKVLTVMGTPTEDIATTKNSLISFAASTSCNTTYLRGTLLRIPEPSIQLISHVQTLNQLVCGVTPIEKIEYQLTDGATNVNVTGLPPGVDWELDDTYLKISGVPTSVLGKRNSATYSQLEQRPTLFPVMDTVSAIIVLP